MTCLRKHRGWCWPWDPGFFRSTSLCTSLHLTRRGRRGGGLPGLSLAGMRGGQSPGPSPLGQGRGRRELWRLWGCGLSSWCTERHPSGSSAQLSLAAGAGLSSACRYPKGIVGQGRVPSTSSFTWNLSPKVRSSLSLSDLSNPLTCDLLEGHWSPKCRPVIR